MSPNDPIAQILKHPLYQEYLHKLTAMEKTRLYCKHDLAHFLDTARIAYISALENNLADMRDNIYATALLHDIGRAIDNERHDEYSAAIAQKILPECGFSESAIKLICEAILAHRNKADNHTLADLIYTADKKSRNCFACPAQASCKWPLDKQNKTLWR